MVVVVMGYHYQLSVTLISFGGLGEDILLLVVVYHWWWGCALPACCCWDAAGAALLAPCTFLINDCCWMPQCCSITTMMLAHTASCVLSSKWIATWLSRHVGRLMTYIIYLHNIFVSPRQACRGQHDRWQCHISMLMTCCWHLQLSSCSAVVVGCQLLVLCWCLRQLVVLAGAGVVCCSM